MRLVTQTNPVIMFGEDGKDKKRENFIIRFTAHRSRADPDAIVLTGLIDNSRASLLAEPPGPRIREMQG